MKLNPSNFFHYHIFHPTAKELPKKEQEIATIAAVILGIFTLGIAHALCYIFFYDRSFAVKKPSDTPKTTQIAERTFPKPETSKKTEKPVPTPKTEKKTEPHVKEPEQAPKVERARLDFLAPDILVMILTKNGPIYPQVGAQIDYMDKDEKTSFKTLMQRIIKQLNEGQTSLSSLGIQNYADLELLVSRAEKVDEKITRIDLDSDTFIENFFENVTTETEPAFQAIKKALLNKYNEGEISSKLLGCKSFDDLKTLVAQAKEFGIPITALDLGSLNKSEFNYSDEVVRFILEMDNLHYLHLAGSFIKENEFIEICKLKSMEVLDLNGVAITTEGGSNLPNIVSNIRELGALKKLVVKSKGVDFSALKEGDLPKLEELTISDCVIMDSLGYISHFIKDLQILELSRSGRKVFDEQNGQEVDQKINAEDIQDLVTGDPKALEELKLIDSGITDEGLKQLSKVKGLQKISIRGDQTITAEGLEHLQGLGLRSLSLPSCPKIKNLNFLQKGFEELRELDLSNCDELDSNSFEHLVRLQKLEKLTLPSGKATDDFLLLLSEHLQNLREIDISYGRFSEKGLASLKKLTGLRKLNLTGCRLVVDPRTMGKSLSEDVLKHIWPPGTHIFPIDIQYETKVRKTPHTSQLSGEQVDYVPSRYRIPYV